MNKIKKICVLVCVLMAACTLSAYPGHYHHHHHHHCGTGLAVGAGILGAGLIASAIYDATHPVPYVAPAPVVVQPAVVQQPVVVQQSVVQPVVQPVAQPPVVQNVWVEGRYVDQPNGAGQTVRVWQPGHFEQR